MCYLGTWIRGSLPRTNMAAQIIEVAPAERRYVGPIQDVISRGCDRLGWSHFAIRRNVRGCEGGGFCDLGCGTDARRSTNLSYIPPALESGALLLTGLSAGQVLRPFSRAETSIRQV